MIQDSLDTGLGSVMSYGLIPFVLGVFVLAVIAKLVIYLVARKQLAFSSAFALRVSRHLEGWYPATRKNDLSFHELVKALLQLTYQDLYVARHGAHRRRPEDPFIHVVNKIFLVEEASQQMVEDTLRQTHLLMHYRNRPPLENVTRFVMNNNHYFNRVWAIVPAVSLSRLFQVLPSLFIIVGILGTFLGITKGLPVLRGIDPANYEATQRTLTEFLGSMSFAMYASVVGILMSILFTVMNTVLSMRSTQLQTFERYTQALDLLWHSVENQREIQPASGERPVRVA